MSKPSSNDMIVLAALVAFMLMITGIFFAIIKVFI